MENGYINGQGASSGYFVFMAEESSNPQRIAKKMGGLGSGEDGISPIPCGSGMENGCINAQAASSGSGYPLVFFKSCACAAFDRNTRGRHSYRRISFIDPLLGPRIFRAFRRLA